MRILFLLVIVSPFLKAQDMVEEKASSIKYTNSFMSGGSVGGSEELWGISISTFHGIKVQQWRLMMGVGLDGYSDWLTYPVMGSVSFDFTRGKRGSLYMVVNSGYAFADKMRPMEWTHTYSHSGGLIFNPMIGYRIQLGDVNLYFQSGYKNQKVSYEYSYYYGGWGDHPGYTNTYVIDQNLNRFVFQIGFGF
jgi:hypothetical protein